MGMAHRAPMDRHKRKYFVSEHAIERLRERWSQMPSHSHRNDPDLGNLIDSAVTYASGAENNSKTYRDTRDGVYLRAVYLGLVLDDSIYALVRENDRRGSGYPDEAIVTIVPTGYVEQRIATGIWETTVGTNMGDAFKKAGLDKLQKVDVHNGATFAAMTSPVFRNAPPGSAAAHPVPTPTAPTEPLVPSERVATMTSYLVQWEDDNDDYKNTECEEMPVLGIDNLKTTLAELHTRHNVRNIRVWKEVKVAVKKTVEVAFDGE